MTKAMDGIWHVCRGHEQFRKLSGTLFRLVENQEQIATWQLVDSLNEQAELEDMLEEIKPPLPKKSDELHYLLKTPFRYPPLKWSSRFGRVHEPSIFYGGGSIDATLAESAYYRFVYWHTMEAPPIKNTIPSQHTMFSVDYQTNEKGIKLQEPPFDQYHELIAHPTDYSHAQQLGTDMRKSEVEVFEYPSSRAADHGHCVGIFTTRNFTQNFPQKQVRWFCDLTADTVTFKSTESGKVWSFSLSDFLHDGAFPIPA